MPSHNGRQKEPSEAYSSSSGSVQSNFSAVAHQQQQRPAGGYEPGTGAAFMAQSGWSNRDEYGRAGARQSTTTTFPVFTPAPRHQQQNAAALQQRFSNASRPHQVTFTEAPNYKKIYLIALVVVTLLLLSLIVAVVILLATKVFIYNAARFSPPSSPEPNPPSAPIFPTPPLLPSSVPVSNSANLVSRTFECEFFILDQANQAYDNANSFEQYQAQTIVQNALISTFEGSSLRDMNPTISLEKLENIGPDLRILFRLGIVVLEQNTGLRELTIRNLLLSEAGALEGLLNRTILDRNRISVRLIS